MVGPCCVRRDLLNFFVVVVTMDGQQPQWLENIWGRAPGCMLIRCLYLLTENRDVEANILAEFDREVGRGKLDTEALGRCDYTRRVIMETLRLYPAGVLRSWRVCQP